jgi:hypothetical protein
MYKGTKNLQNNQIILPDYSPIFTHIRNYSQRKGNNLPKQENPFSDVVSLQL